MTNTDRSEFAASHPRDEEKFARLLCEARPGWEVVSFDVTECNFPKDFSGFDGIMVGGSPASVHDESPWIAQLLSALRQAVAAEVALFGACFGHQAIALALGGAVGPNPAGWSLGSVPTEVILPQPWMAGGAASVRLHAAHKEQVTRLPVGARAWGRAAGCPTAGFVLGPRIFTTQYHPEITPEFMSALLDEMETQSAANEDDLARGRSSLSDPAENGVFGEWIARFFEAATGLAPPRGRFG